MHARTIFTACFGGIVASLTLGVAFYGIWPARYTSDWGSLPSSMEWLSYGFTLIVLVLTGALAGESSQANARSEKIRSGIWAGLLAGCVVFSLVGASWAGMAGHSDLLQNLYPPPGNDTDYEIILGTSFTSVTWWVHLTFWGLMVVGFLCGMIGGLLSSIGAPHSQNKVPVPGLLNSLPPFILAIYTALLLVAGVVFNVLLHNQIGEMYMRIGFHPTGIDKDIWPVLDVPIITTLILLLILALLCWRIILNGWNHPATLVRWMLRGAVFLGPFLGVATCFYMEISRFTIFLSASFFSILMAYAAWHFRRPVPEQPPNGPSTAYCSSWPAFFLLMGSYGAAFTSVAGASQYLSSILIAVTNIPILSNQPSSSPIPTVHESIKLLFQYQILITVISALALIVISGIAATMMRIFIAIMGTTRTAKIKPLDNPVETELETWRKLSTDQPKEDSQDIWSR